MGKNCKRIRADNDSIGKKTLEGFVAAENYNRWLASRVLPHMRGKEILEIGCGLGNISRIISEKYTLTCVDIRKDYTDKVTADLGARTVCVDLAQQKAFDNEFDGAVSLNVLEHIEDEQAALENIFKALRPGGRFAVLVPAFNWLYGSVDKAIFHQRRYTRSRLKKTVQSAGFEVEKTFYFNAFGIPGWFWQNHIRKRELLPEGQLTLFSRLVPILKVLDIPFRPVLGISVVAWAVKPETGLKSTPMSRREPQYPLPPQHRAP